MYFLGGNKIGQNLSIRTDGSRSFIAGRFYGKDGSTQNMTGCSGQNYPFRRFGGNSGLFGPNSDNRIHPGSLERRDKTGEYSNNDADEYGQQHIAG